MQNLDKAQHFIVGMITGLFPIYPMIAILLVAWGKELYDYKHSDKHTCDATDAIATIVGGLVTLQLMGS